MCSRSSAHISILHEASALEKLEQFVSDENASQYARMQLMVFLMFLEASWFDSTFTSRNKIFWTIFLQQGTFSARMILWSKLCSLLVVYPVTNCSFTFVNVGVSITGWAEQRPRRSRCLPFPRNFEFHERRISKNTCEVSRVFRSLSLPQKS